MTKIAAGGLAEADGRLRLGDKLLQVRRDNTFFAYFIELVDDVEWLEIASNL